MGLGIRAVGILATSLWPGPMIVLFPKHHTRHTNETYRHTQGVTMAWQGPVWHGVAWLIYLQLPDSYLHTFYVVNSFVWQSTACLRTPPPPNQKKTLVRMLPLQGLQGRIYIYIYIYTYIYIHIYMHFILFCILRGGGREGGGGGVLKQSVALSVFEHIKGAGVLQGHVPLELHLLNALPGLAG